MRNECNENNGDCISKEVVGNIAWRIFKFGNLLITHSMWSGISDGVNSGADQEACSDARRMIFLPVETIKSCATYLGKLTR